MEGELTPSVELAATMLDEDQAANLLPDGGVGMATNIPHPARRKTAHTATRAVGTTRRGATRHGRRRPPFARGVRRAAFGGSGG